MICDADGCVVSTHMNSSLWIDNGYIQRWMINVLILCTSDFLNNFPFILLTASNINTDTFPVKTCNDSLTCPVN